MVLQDLVKGDEITIEIVWGNSIYHLPSKVVVAWNKDIYIEPLTYNGHVIDLSRMMFRDMTYNIYAINKELEKYNPEIAKRPQVIAANKTDAIIQTEPEAIDIDENGDLIYDETVIDPITRIRKEFEPQGYAVFPISAISGTGIKELLYHVQNILDECEDEPIIFEQEYFPDMEMPLSNEPFTVEYDEEEEEYVVEGPRIEKMLGYTNLESEKGFQFFQKFMKENGILDQLENLGIQEGDTVRMYGLQFDYYKS